MSNRTTTDLISCLQAATGPDRALDGAIAGHINPSWPIHYGPDDIYQSVTLESRPFPIRHYTASVDAALTLVPDGLTWQLGKWLSKSGDGSPVFWFDLHGHEEGSVRHIIAAVAILIAALKAREAGR